MEEFIFRIEEAINQPNLLFDSWQVIVRIALTSIFFYFLLIVLLKLFGKRTIATFSVYDFVVTLTIGSVIASTLVLVEVNFLNGVIAVVVFLGLQFIVALVTSRWPRINALINPSPKVLFFKGKFVEENLKSARINKEEVYSAIRTQANTTSDQVYAAIIEVHGSISVITNVTEGYEYEITKYMEEDNLKKYK